MSNELKAVAETDAIAPGNINFLSGVTSDPLIDTEQSGHGLSDPFGGLGLAMRKETDPPIPGEPLMSMEDARRIYRELEVYTNHYRRALESIANNTCCASCREAALVARAALETNLDPVLEAEPKTTSAFHEGDVVGRTEGSNPSTGATPDNINVPYNECLVKLRPFEPFFVLLGRDAQAIDAVRYWIHQRELTEGRSAKTERAYEVIRTMADYQRQMGDISCR